MEIPDAVHHHGVVVVVMGPDPAQQRNRKEAINPGAMQGLHWHPGESEVGRTGGVKGGDLQAIAKGVVGGGYLPDSLNRATTKWIHRLNNVEYLQWHWVKIF
jgi:hypothetical protein